MTRTRKALTWAILTLLVVALAATAAHAAPTLYDRAPRMDAKSLSRGDWRNSQVGHWQLRSGYLRTLGADAAPFCRWGQDDLKADGSRLMRDVAYNACAAHRVTLRSLIRQFPRPATHVVMTIKVECTNWACDTPRPTVYVTFLRWGLPA